MTTIDTNRAIAQPTGLADRAGRILANLFGTLAAWNDARITRNSLSRLTNRELDDIGLTRNDIEMIAARGARI